LDAVLVEKGLQGGVEERDGRIFLDTVHLGRLIGSELEAGRPAVSRRREVCNP
jgi:hypothetical protein